MCSVSGEKTSAMRSTKVYLDETKNQLDKFSSLLPAPSDCIASKKVKAVRVTEKSVFVFSLFESLGLLFLTKSKIRIFLCYKGKNKAALSRLHYRKKWILIINYKSLYIVRSVLCDFLNCVYIFFQPCPLFDQFCWIKKLPDSFNPKKYKCFVRTKIDESEAKWNCLQRVKVWKHW